MLANTAVYPDWAPALLLSGNIVAGETISHVEDTGTLKRVEKP